jgi:hypothetical protein
MGGMFQEAVFEEPFEEDLFNNLDFDYILNLASNNDTIFIQEVVEEGPFSRTSITENLIPDTTYIGPLILEQQTRTDERRNSIEQIIISNNYHNIFNLDKQLVKTSQNYLNEIQTAVQNFNWSFENPTETIQNNFRIISENFISGFLTIIDDRNNMLDSTKVLVLNYELY